MVIIRGMIQFDLYQKTNKQYGKNEQNRDFTVIINKKYKVNIKK